MGLTGNSVQQMRSWFLQGRSVTIRFRAEERCEFDREAKREQEQARFALVCLWFFVSFFQSKMVREFSGGGKTTDMVVTTITEYFWKFCCSYELFAFAGTDSEDEGSRVVLQRRRSECEIMTVANVVPRPQVRIIDPIDWNVTFLLSRIDDNFGVSFSIDRADPCCKTPRRNRSVDEMCAFSGEMELFSMVLESYLRDVLSVPKSALDFESLNDKTVFVPVIPLFGPIQHVDEYVSLQSLLVRPTAGAALGVCDQLRLLDEQKRSLLEKLSSVAKAFGEDSQSATLVVTAVHLQTLSTFLSAGVQLIEDLLRKQIVAAIGKSVTAVDFANYMVFHNKQCFREKFRPVPFSYAVRRPLHTPEGVISLEASRQDGSAAEPVPTMVCTSVLEDSMQFSLHASSKVAFQGQVHVHGLMMHQFEGESGFSLSLNARARQFSCFLVLVGRMAGPGLFDPQFGIICKNKDEITIPLDVETIPSAGEFKAATVSISPEQQAFSKMFRVMQLASSLFAVCVIQVKPQLERLLRLQDDSLTKQIELTQLLLDLFIQYHIPSDLLLYGGSSSDPDVRIASVQRSAQRVQLLIEGEKLKQEEEALTEKQREIAALNAKLLSPLLSPSQPCQGLCCGIRKTKKKKIIIFRFAVYLTCVVLDRTMIVVHTATDMYPGCDKHAAALIARDTSVS